MSFLIFKEKRLYRSDNLQVYIEDQLGDKLEEQSVAIESYLRLGTGY